MKEDKRMLASVLEVLLGIGLIIGSVSGMLDAYWHGMGSALVIVGSMFLFRQIRYRTNSSYREAVDVEKNDERNKYLAVKAWSWAGYLFVMIAAVASILLKIAGLDELSTLAGGAVCLIVVLYWLSYLYLRKKY